MREPILPRAVKLSPIVSGASHLDSAGVIVGGLLKSRLDLFSSGECGMTLVLPWTSSTGSCAVLRFALSLRQSAGMVDASQAPAMTLAKAMTPA